MLRNYSDRAWGVLAAGRDLPASRDGTWLRNAFKYSVATWTDAYLDVPSLPAGARILINGREPAGMEADSDLSLKSYLRTGTNSVVLAFPPHREGAASVPEVRIKRIRAGTGKADPVIKLRSWRHRRDRIERFLDDKWIASSDTSAWRLTAARPLASGEMWLPAGPVCLKAALDFPRYWAGRELSVYFHDVPGDPDVYVNGKKMIDRLNCPSRLDLKSALRFDGRDSICLVFPELPRVMRPRDGEWGMVAIHWRPNPRLPLFASGATLLYEPIGQDPDRAGRQALAYASQVLAVSSSPFELDWAFRERDRCPAAPQNRDMPGSGAVLLAAWPEAPFSREILDPLAERIEARRDELAKAGADRIWIMSVPAVGDRSESIPNSRLMVFRNRVNDMADSEKVRIIPVFDVFRSALRCQRRWPASPLFADAEGRLTPHGSYLAGLAILDAFSLP